MILDTNETCASCAWRGACAKKHTMREAVLHCPDFSRDLSFGAGDGTERTVERHKQIEDVFGTRK